MSSGRECELVKVAPNEWFYILQSGFCPTDCWDWREHEPIVGGPFPSEDECTESLLRDNSNPGGWMVQALRPDQAQATLDDTVRELIEQARRRSRVAPACRQRGY